MNLLYWKQNLKLAKNQHNSSNSLICDAQKFTILGVAVDHNQRLNPTGPHSSMSSPFLRSLSGGSVGCSDSSSISWVTASLWGLGTRRLDIPQSPSAPSCPWEACVSILPQEGTGECPRRAAGGMGHRPSRLCLAAT